MKFYILYIIPFFLLLAGRLEAQLSPGPLTNAHQHLEGISNCTQCHEMGNKVSSDKCLNCHKEIQWRLDHNVGYHNSTEVKGKSCAQCHNDHHGRSFDQVRFDEQKFNHRLTGYELTGAHQKIDCRQCHQADHIEDAGLKKRKETFLGLDDRCISCHQDRHQNTLGKDCAKCHTTDVFKPAGKFSHDQTDFALTGKHKTVDCIECHQKEIRNGVEYQRFSGVPFKNCNSCHADPHQNQLGTNCRECHSDQSFTASAGWIRFNHNHTLFLLKGKHKQVNCRECHNLHATPLTVFQDRKGVQQDACRVCHKDVHEGKLGDQCAGCHNENSFRNVENLSAFNHDRTGFELEGKHEAVDCRKCHVSESMTEPVPHNTCATCHTDYHKGEFENTGIRPDCGKCHSVEGFSEPLFTLEDHKKTKFPLEGAHVATPCIACHQQKGQWIFRGLGERCVDCHQDVHVGEIAAKWYPNQACEQCHQPADWRENRFDHSKTAFPLQGAHAKQDCRACHQPDETHRHGQFAGLAATCASCHKDEHRGQFEINGVVNCARCHGLENWDIQRFDHNKTKFKLEGKHVAVKCAGCHQPITQHEETFIQYKFASLECVVCHR